MNVLEVFKNVTTFVFDVDGVMTDSTVLLLENGLQARQMHVKDGFGLQMAMKHGYRVFIVSGGVSEESGKRLEYLGIKDIHFGVADKTNFIADLLKSNKIKWEEVLYMGDDLPDMPLMSKVGLSACPADAVSEVRTMVKYISPVNGGWGCVRDVIEKVLKLRNDWELDVTIPSK